MATIYDYMTADNVVAYWDEKNLQETEGLLGEELFPAEQKLGLKLEWVYGANGLPVVLLPSAYDAVFLKRDRIGFESIETNMPFFKEGTDIDEELRQQLNMVLETGNQQYINMIFRRIFDDQMRLLRGARAQRERMRMSLLMTGGISIKANGQNYDYDYGMKDYQKKTVSVSWSDSSADIIQDITDWQDSVEDVTGVRPTRIVINSNTKKYFKNNKLIKNGIWGNDSTAPVRMDKIMDYIEAETKSSIVVYTKKYVDETGAVKSYVPDDTLAMFPPGPLGKSWFGTTPEQSDLMAGSAANVAITDTGVAVTTIKKTDPVNVDTKVSMIFLPSFEQIPNLLIADLKKAASGGAGGGEDDNG